MICSKKCLLGEWSLGKSLLDGDPSYSDENYSLIRRLLGFQVSLGTDADTQAVIGEKPKDLPKRLGISYVDSLSLAFLNSSALAGSERPQRHSQMSPTK